MTQTDTASKITSIIAEQLNVDAGTLKPDTDIHVDLAIASLDYVEVLIELEKTFNIYISDAESDKVKTLADLTRIVSSKL